VTRFGVTQQELGLRAVEKYAPAYFFERKANFRKTSAAPKASPVLRAS